MCYGFFWYAVDTNLFRLGSTNPKNNSQTLDASDYYGYKEVGINNLAELRCAKVQLGRYFMLYKWFMMINKINELFDDQRTRSATAIAVADHNLVATTIAAVQW